MRQRANRAAAPRGLRRHVELCGRRCESHQISVTHRSYTTSLSMAWPSGLRGGTRRRRALEWDAGSSVLRSRRAIAANILIMRTFVQLRRAQGQYAELRDQIAELARKVQGHDELLDEILRALEALAPPPPSRSRPIGFRTPTDDQRPSAKGDGSAHVSSEPNAGRASG